MKFYFTFIDYFFQQWLLGLSWPVPEGFSDLQLCLGSSHLWILQDHYPGKKPAYRTILFNLKLHVKGLRHFCGRAHDFENLVSDLWGWGGFYLHTAYQQITVPLPSFVLKYQAVKPLWYCIWFLEVSLPISSWINAFWRILIWRISYILFIHSRFA